MKSLFFLAVLVVLCSCSASDPNTFSNYQDAQLNHLHIEWFLNLDNKYINATAIYDFKVLPSQGLDAIWLDVYQLNVHLVYIPSDGTPLVFTTDVIDNQTFIQGDRLNIRLNRRYTFGEEFQLKIKYSLDTRSRAINFLNREQTQDQTQPFLFSQCEMNNCRAMIPLQDTPAVKITYTATTIVRQDIQVYMTGNQTVVSAKDLIGDYPNIKELLIAGKYNFFGFESKIRIPAYLIAIVAGAVVEKQVGSVNSRAYVISEPSMIALATSDLADLDKYITTLESVAGPYMWGAYKIVILPPSFPFGGMENPLLTFASPSIIVGDKSGVSVAIHEIAHSWTGNSITCVNWQNFWINEGFTVYLERRALSLLPEFGVDWANIDSIVGNAGLLTDIAQFGENDSYSSLYPDTKGKNPDDSFSEVAYEKGFQLLYTLEMDYFPVDTIGPMVKDLISQFRYQSIDETDVKNFFISWVKANVQDNADLIVQVINNQWDRWVKVPGKPPVAPAFSSLRVYQARKLANDYINAAGTQPTNYAEFTTYLTNQKYIFLQYLIDNYAQLTPAIINTIETDQKLTEYANKEIQWRWFTMQLKANYQNDLIAIDKFLGSIGRQKMILPIYRALNSINHTEAVRLYNKYKNFYHPLAAAAVNSIVNGN